MPREPCNPSEAEGNKQQGSFPRCYLGIPFRTYVVMHFHARRNGSPGDLMASFVKGHRDPCGIVKLKRETPGLAMFRASSRALGGECILHVSWGNAVRQRGKERRSVGIPSYRLQKKLRSTTPRNGSPHQTSGASSGILPAPSRETLRRLVLKRTSSDCSNVWATRRQSQHCTSS